MQVLSGTSGFSYKQWKGPFYPEKLAEKKFLDYYAAQLPTVEINNTFYRLPKAEMLAGWADRVPESFQFVIKASQRITHKARLGDDAAEPTGYLWQACQSLGAHLGPILFQLPPYLRKDLDRLKTFVAGLPDGLRAVFEFRHETWVDDEVHRVLRDAGCALCIADHDKDEQPPEVVATADWGYLRLRRSGYSDAELDAWVTRVKAQSWTQAFVFFKHEDEGMAPQLARTFMAKFE